MTLRRYFTLHVADREKVGRCRGAANTLGTDTSCVVAFAVQLCTLRWRGHFLRDMAGVPSVAVEALAEQVGLLPRAATLYPLACRRLLEQRVVRPGASTIRDLLAHAREHGPG